MNRKVLAAAIVAGGLLAWGIGAVLLTKGETPASQASTVKSQQEDASRPADSSQAQIEQAPQRSQDVFMPPASTGTGTSRPAPEPR